MRNKRTKRKEEEQVKTKKNTRNKEKIHAASDLWLSSLAIANCCSSSLCLFGSNVASVVMTDL